jgi:hypothetical protein
VLLGSRLVVALAGIVVLGVTVLWMVRQAGFSHSLTAGGNGLGTGVALALLGGLLMCLAACALPGRRRPVRSAEPAVPAGAAGPTGPSGRDHGGDGGEGADLGEPPLAYGEPPDR